MLEDVTKPSGEVSAVCWSLMGAMVVGFFAAIKWIIGKNDALEKKLEDKDKENDTLRDARLEDREKLLAQTNVSLNTLMAKKRGESP